MLTWGRHTGLGTTGLWPRQAVALLLPPNTWLVDVSRLGDRMEACWAFSSQGESVQGWGRHSPGPRSRGSQPG